MNPPPTTPPSPPQATPHAFALDALVGAALQKLWLLSPAHAVLQLRTPGRNVHAVIDARGAVGAIVQLVDERPNPPEPALGAQANLRRLLEGARVIGARTERFVEGEGARKTALRISLESPQGARALVAEARTQLLFVLGADARGDGERVLWAAPGSPAERRSGTRWPAVVEVARTAQPSAEATGENDAAGPGAEPAAADPSELAAIEERSLDQRKTLLLRELRTRMKKLARAQTAVAGDHARAKRGDEERKNAELLLPHQGKIERGARTATVPDWSQLDDAGAPLQTTLVLDPALSAAENAARWLRHAQRVRAALPRIEARQAELARALAGLHALESRLGAAQDRGVLETLAAELGETARGSAMQRPERAGPGRPAKRTPWRTFLGTSGARILVGRSARDNDALTRQAKGNDLWLHARGVQGSHVILPAPGDAPDATTLGEAALLAAHFSSGRGADDVLVSWTRRKFVRKGKGAAPGAVTFTQEKTLRVRLDAARLARLLASEQP